MNEAVGNLDFMELGQAFNFHSLDWCVYDFEYQLVNAVCISALLNELIFQLHKAM